MGDSIYDAAYDADVTVSAGPATADTPADPVLAAIRRSVAVVLPDLDPDLVAPGRTLTELGCNSVDRAEVVALTMEDLDVSVPVSEFAEVHDLAALTAVLRRHLR